VTTHFYKNSQEWWSLPIRVHGVLLSEVLRVYDCLHTMCKADAQKLGTRYVLLLSGPSKDSTLPVRPVLSYPCQFLICDGPHIKCSKHSSASLLQVELTLSRSCILNIQVTLSSETSSNIYYIELFGFFWTLSIVWYVEVLQKTTTFRRLDLSPSSGG
jgi:hypothetical protein